MSLQITKKISVVLLLVILVVGFLLRYHDYTHWPREGATFDEFAWTFLGLSLWEKGIPTSWSPHPEYKNRVEYKNPQGARFTLVTPYLEHPPLFGLIAGGFARLRGITSFGQVTSAKIRPFALFLGTLSIFAVYILANAVYGTPVGLLSAFLYAIIPTVAIGSRLVQNENFFIPFFLFALYFAYQYIHRHRQCDLVITTILCAVLPLAKVPWIAASLAVSSMFIFAKKWRAALLVLLATCLCFSGFIIWGMTLDKALFINLWKLQLARYDLTFDSLFTIFREPIIADRTLVDGWIYFGWAAMVMVLLKDIKKNLPIVLGFLAYGAIFVFAIPSEPLHGWYRYPFYPFLVISIAVFLYESFDKKYFAMALFSIVTGLSMFAESWGKILGFSFLIFRTYLGTIAVGALPGIFPKLEQKKVFRWVNIVIFCIIILLSVSTILIYNEQ